MKKQRSDSEEWRSRSAREGAGRMTREQKYTEQLQAMGVWQEAFAPEIHTLAMMERELQRMIKVWKAQGSPITDETANGTPTSNKMYDAIMGMRRDILAHRDALGLTPKGLHRLRPKAADDGGSGKGQISVLEQIRQKGRA